MRRKPGFGLRLKRMRKVTTMRCKCGSEIDNVPEHLKDLATWICSKCTNTSPRGESVIARSDNDESLEKKVVRRPRKAA